MDTIFQNDAEYVDTNADAEPEEFAATKESDVTNNTASDDAVAVAVERGRWHRDAIFAYFTDTDGNEQAFDLTRLPANVKDHLAYLGFSVYVGRSKDRKEAYNSLVEGHISMRKPAGPKAVKVNDWRKAIASAFVEATTKTLAPMTLDDATAKAVALTTEQVRNVKTDAVVIKHYNKLKGTTGGLSSLLAA
jgi:IMP cyclohydrolase